MRTGPTNTTTQRLIVELEKLSKKEKAPIWNRIAEELSKSTRSRREVALYTLDSNLENGEIGIVPGKVLSNGEFSKKNTIAAFKFSEQAKEKIAKSGGKTLTIQQLIKENPKGKKVRIIG